MRGERRKTAIQLSSEQTTLPGMNEALAQLPWRKERASFRWGEVTIQRKGPAVPLWVVEDCRGNEGTPPRENRETKRLLITAGGEFYLGVSQVGEQWRVQRWRLCELDIPTWVCAFPLEAGNCGVDLRPVKDPFQGKLWWLEMRKHLQGCGSVFPPFDWMKGGTTLRVLVETKERGGDSCPEIAGWQWVPSEEQIRQDPARSLYQELGRIFPFGQWQRRFDSLAAFSVRGDTERFSGWDLLRQLASLYVTMRTSDQSRRKTREEIEGCLIELQFLLLKLGARPLILRRKLKQLRGFLLRHSTPTPLKKSSLII